MLQQILNDMYIEPVLLAELDEEQKQLLFCKMREEQVRKWNLSELEVEQNEKTSPKKLKQGGKKVSFKLGLDGEPVVAVIGSDSGEAEEMLEKKAKHQAGLGADALRLAAEEELDKLVNLSHSTVHQMETASTKQEMNPTREAVVQSLQEAKLELEEKMRSEEVTQQNMTTNSLKVEPAKVILNTPKTHNGDKPLITVGSYNSKVNSQILDKNVPLLSSNNNNCLNPKQKCEPNCEKLKNVGIAPENKTPSVPLYLVSQTSAYPSSGASSMVTIRSMISNPISDFPLRKKSSDEIALGVAAHVKQFERLSNSSLEALKTATLERAKKRREKEILDYLRQQADLAHSKEPEEVAWREQERKAKNAERRIREIARRAREEHRRVAAGVDDPALIGGTPTKPEIPDKSRALQDINGNTNLHLENARNVSLKPATEKKTHHARNSEAKTEILIKPSKPPSRQAIIEWFIAHELPKGSGLDAKQQKVADWFHGIISRNEAEEILLNVEVGSFLVRVSERIWGYVVSYRSSDRCRHYLIDITDGSYAFLGSYKNTHSSLYNLIDYHRTHAITTSGDESELLLKPCCQKPPKEVYEELFSGTAYEYD